jgi:AraC family transcriptional regulator of adaptative response/methylated-DNA-[protein]-cysteine methyltransferase
MMTTNQAGLKACTTTDDRWTAVLTRDANVDGQFVYAVSSTGIYCKPSCASRRPRRDRVVFFDTADDAVRAGYRACRRCKPDAASTVDPWIEKVRRACVYLANVDGHVSLAHLAARLGGSPYHLQRSFKRLVGVTPARVCRAYRLRKDETRLAARRARRRALRVDAARQLTRM